LEQFKVDLKKEIKEGEHDLELVKWLIARQWNVKNAETMFLNSMKWRAKIGADHILEEFPKSPYYKFLTENYPTNHSDPRSPKIFRIRDGSHLCIESMGNLNPEAAALIPPEEIIRYHIWSMELADKIRRDCAKELGYKYVMQSFIVEDLDGIGLGHLSMSFLLKQFTTIDNANYPETLRKVIIVNVPTIFSMVWSAVQYFWDEHQKAKFQFVSSSENHSPILLKVISPEYLPKSYGGSLDYAIPKKTIEQLKVEINAIPKKQFLEDFVPRSGTLEKVFDLTQIGSFFHYEFKTTDYDISFGIKYRPSKDSKTEEIVPNTLCESNVIPIFARLPITKAGQYILVWDNTNSWTRGKQLFYTTSVCPK